MDFAELKDVGLRTVWRDEAQDFTPWLAENLGRLSRAIGIPLEHEGSEVQVGQFSADIVARNPVDRSRVLIENQLEGSDHKHLGQILTYLAGVQAQTVVWVARDFEEAHRSAIRWPFRDRLGVEIGDATPAGSYANSSYSCDTANRDTWPDATKWLHDKILEYREVLEAAPEPAAD